MTGCLFFGSLGISMMVHSLGLMLAVVGATGSTTISYILPGYFYMSLFGDEERGPMYYGARTMFIAGCIIIPCALGLIAGTGKGGG